MTVSDENEANVTGSIGGTIDKVVLGKGQIKQLSVMSKKKSLTRSTLIAMAVHNELQKEKPFEPFNIDSSDYVENSYAEEGQRIKDFLRNKRTGVPLEFMACMHDDLNIRDSDSLIMGVQQCLSTGAIYETDVDQEMKDRTNTSLPLGCRIFVIVKDETEVSANTRRLRGKKISKKQREEEQLTRLKKNRPDLF